MPTPSAEKLEYYYALKTLTADGQASPVRTTDAGSDADALVNAAFTEADDFWNGAIGRFEDDTETVILRGVYFHVRDFVQAATKIVLAQTLPAAPSTTGGTEDTFRLFLGGNFRAAQRIPGLDATGPVNITGVVIDRTGHANGNGAASGTLDFVNATTEMSWQAPGDASAGAPVDVSIDDTYTLFSADADKWITVTVTAAALPTLDQSDTIVLTTPERELLPDMEGYETENGKTRYHLVVIKNADTVDAMTDLRAFVEAADPGSPTTTTGSLGTTAAALTVADATDWPVRSFWVRNVTKNDLRYIQYRSGNTLHAADAGAGLRGFTAQTWDVGDAVEVFPEIDIGLDAPAAGSQFENPAAETSAPAGVTFSAPADYSGGLAIGNVAAGGLHGVWLRETVVADPYARADFTNPLRLQWS